ncbi:MAG: transcriptional repressor LexA [candidate division Zixibacteria bacterium]|jgi:repressor LexA|nr:transcriptional repressor LexA [candidate division Zixibacteria bacterium]
MKDLTKRQRQIFEFIKRSVADLGRPPSLREIGEKFGINSTNGVRTALEALERKGYIRRNRYLSRGIEILKEAQEYLDPEKTLMVPWIGRVAAGTPLWAEQNIEGNFCIDRSFVTGDQIFALRVKGDSMMNAGILDGDFVLVRRQETADRGEIVVAQIGDEATVKRYYPEKKRIRLEPENPAYGPIIVEKGSPGFTIAGKVVGLLRRM